TPPLSLHDALPIYRSAHTLRPARSVQALEHAARHLNDATPMSVLDTARPDASASGGRRLSVDGTSRLPGGATRAVSLRIDRSEPIASRRSPPDRVSQRRAEPDEDTGKECTGHVDPAPEGSAGGAHARHAPTGPAVQATADARAPARRAAGPTGRHR